MTGKLTPLVKEIELDIKTDDLYRIFYDDDDVSILCNCYDEAENKYFDIIGFDSHLKLKAENRIDLTVEIDGAESVFQENPLLILKDLFDRYRTDMKFPFPFAGGGIGYLGYELYNLLAGKDNREYPSGSLVPDMYLNFYRIYLIIDKTDNKKYILSLDFSDGIDKRVENQFKRLEKFEKKLNYGMIFYKDELREKRKAVCGKEQKAIEADVAQIKEEIKNGSAEFVYYSVPFKLAYPYSSGELFSRVNESSEHKFSSYIKSSQFTVLTFASEFAKNGDNLVYEVADEKNPIAVAVNHFPSFNYMGSSRKESAPIIAETELFSRGVFSGMVGYFSLDGFVKLHTAAESWIVKDEELNFREGVMIDRDSENSALAEEILSKADETVSQMGD